jgi:hypothetical protein
MPLLFGHSSTIDIPALGSVIEARKDKGADGMPILRTTGGFNLQGDGPLAAIRRDVAQLVNDGDLPAVSIRWEGEGVPRVELPVGHPYRVERDVDGPQRWGMFFATSRAKEGSIVALGSDPRALSGRADAAKDGRSRVFFWMLAEPEVREQEEFVAALSQLAAARTALASLGVTGSDMVRLLDVDEGEPLVRIAYGEEQSALIPQAVYETICGDARKMAREAFDLARNTPIAPSGAVPVTVAPAQDTTARERNSVVNEMGVSVFQQMLTRTLSEAVFSKTGRR